MSHNPLTGLYKLPVDATLHALLQTRGLALPADFPTGDTVETSKALAHFLNTHAPSIAQKRIVADLRESSTLADEWGRRALFQVAHGNPSALAAYAAAQGAEHCALVFYVRFPDLFDRARDLHNFDRSVTQAQQHDLKIKAAPDQSLHALDELSAALGAFYYRQMQCGESVKAQIIERSAGVYLLSLYVKDLPQSRLEFEGDVLTRRVGHPHIHALLEYSAATGIARSIIRGGAKYHEALLTAFATHLLHTKVEADRILPPALNLAVLKTGFNVPHAQTDGFIALQVKSLTLLSPDQTLKLECTATAEGEHRCVTDLLNEKVPGLLAQRWSISAATLNLYYPREAHRAPARVVSVELTSKGRLNLHKYDSAMQQQLEGYLVSAGIMKSHDTLTAHEVRADADISTRRDH